MVVKRKSHLLLICMIWLILAGCSPETTPASSPTAAPARDLVATPTAFPATPTLLPSPTLTPSPEPSATPTETEPLSSVAGARSLGDPYAPELGNTGYDVEQYTLKLAFNPPLPQVEGEAEIIAVTTMQGLAELSLDFIGFDIGAVTFDGAPVETTRENDKLIIFAPEPMPAGTAFTLNISYSGSPVTQSSRFVPFVDHLGLQFLGNNIYAINEPDGARYWFPANDHPLDKAGFRFEISVPTGLTGVANGTLIEEAPLDGRTLFIWEHDFPMATYLATIAVGEYERIDGVSPGGIPLRHYVFPDVRTPFETSTAVTGEFIDWMAETFGPYPFDSFGFVTTRVIRASLETQSMVLLSENMLNEETVIHEIIHQWFGDHVSMASWADMWHNEGFAIYVTLLWQTQETPASLSPFLEPTILQYQPAATGPRLGSLDPGQLFSSSSYWGGAGFLHTLRLEVGDDAFFEALRLYFERFGGGAASRADFMDLMEETSGQELDALFADWLE